MPRDRKPQVPTGQPYGEKKRLEDAIAAGGPLQAPLVTPPPSADPLQAAMAKLPLGPGPVPGGLFGPTTRPTEPVTAGAPVGAGPNQVPGLGRRNVSAEVLARLADSTGDSLIAGLAARAQQMGV
jgi:hypothetical protein